MKSKLVNGNVFDFVYQLREQRIIKVNYNEFYSSKEFNKLITFL